MHTSISLRPRLATQAQRALKAVALRLGNACRHGLRKRQASLNPLKRDTP